MKSIIALIPLITILGLKADCQVVYDQPSHWPIAEQGLDFFEKRNYPKAMEKLEEALEYIEEYSDDNIAKAYYHYAKSIQRITPGDDFKKMAEVYRAYKEAAKYGSGWYKTECEIETGDWKSGMKRRYIGEIDYLESEDLTKEDVDLLIWAAKELELFGDVKMFQDYINKIEEKELKLYLP